MPTGLFSLGNTVVKFSRKSSCPIRPDVRTESVIIEATLWLQPFSICGNLPVMSYIGRTQEQTHGFGEISPSFLILLS